MTKWSFTYRGSEVRHPAGRAAIAVLALLGAVVGLLGAVLFIVVGVPMCLLLQGPLRLLGRRGTIRRDGYTLNIKLDGEAYRRIDGNRGGSSGTS